MGVAATDGTSGFERWLGEISFNVDDPGHRARSWLPWLRDFYDAHGPVPPDVVTAAAAERYLKLARRCVDTVLADLDRTSGVCPVIEVDIFESRWVRITVDGSYTQPSMEAIDEARALAEVADYLQEQLVWHPSLGSVWPVCGTHEAGLHAGVHEGTAVWWCRRGGHAVAAIGALAADG